LVGNTPQHNILDVVDFDLRFIYVLAGWEGSTHDALILADSLEREDGLKVPQGKKKLVLLYTMHTFLGIP
jgi:hypothetical protein